MTAEEIISAFGTVRSLADALGRPPSLVWRWKTRGIPAHEFPGIVDEAQRRRLKAITFEVLATHTAPGAVRRSPKPVEPASSAEREMA
ncbi:carph-isopro domain-containing protein [Roseomonas xinghualingensis]|uniref:carph-isopro domain-containing protein n=1 Tax=Roseomonas xinghualingensis TaxID=2986475 RepID=UPI00366D6317